MKPRFALILLVGVASLLGAGADGARAQIHLAVPYSVRSYGMGLSGVADDYDPHNAYYNPAVLGAVHGLAFCGSLHPDLVHPGDDSHGWNGMFVFGKQRKTGESSVFGFGVGLIYSGWDLENVWYVPEASEHSIGLDAGFRYVISGNSSIGFGFGMKSWIFDTGSRYYGWYRSSDEKSVFFDAGLLISHKKVSESGKVYSTSVGLSGVNWEWNTDSDSYISYNLAEGRIGMGLRVDRPGHSSADGQVTNGPSQWRLSANLDLIVRENRKPVVHTGAEFSIREIGFLRTGFQKVLGADNAHNFTLGMGVGYDWGRVKFRIDYARVPAWQRGRYDYPLDFFGLYLGYAFDPVSL